MPALVRTEKVCFALTIPKTATLPATGWPLVVYHHGTGGSMRSFVSDGVAEQLAAMTPAGRGLQLRRRRARRAQGRVDEEARRPGLQPAEPARRARQLPAGRGRHPAGAARRRGERHGDVVADGRGHRVRPGEGRVLRALAGEHVGRAGDRVSAPPPARAVFSGAGAYLTASLLDKTMPVNISRGHGVPDRRAARRRAPGDDAVPELLRPVGSAQLQPADRHAPARAVPSKHVYMSWGKGDTYTPRSTLEANAHSLGLSPGRAPLIDDLRRPRRSRAR